MLMVVICLVAFLVLCFLFKKYFSMINMYYLFKRIRINILFCQFSDYSWENSGNAGAAEGNINGLTNDSKAIYLLLSIRGQSEGRGWETKASNVILSVHQLKELGGSTLPVDRRSNPSAIRKNDSSRFHSFIH